MTPIETIGTIFGTLLFAAILLAPAIVVAWRTRTTRGNVLIPTRRLLFLVTMITPVSLVLSFLSLFVSLFYPFIIALGLAIIMKPRGFNSDDLQSDSLNILKNLKRIQSDIEATSIHLQNLSTTIQTSQTEIEGKEKRRVALQKEIEKQLRDVDAWQRLSEDQKELFVQAAREAMRRKSFFETAAIVGGGLALNIAASLIWAFMGSPGKGQLVNFFEHLIR